MNLKQSEVLEKLSKEQLIAIINTERVENQRMEAAIEASVIITWEYNLRTERLLLGKGTAKIIGLSGDEGITLKDLLSRVHPEDTELIQLNFIKYLEKYPESHEYHVRIKDKDNNYRWISSVGKLKRDEEGHAQTISGTLRDITARKTTEENYQMSQNRFQVLAEHAKEGIVIYNNGIITDVNDAACKIFGMKYKDFVGGRLDELTDPNTYDKLETFKNSGEYIDFTIKTPQGEKRYLEVLNKQTQNVGIILVNDITTRKQAEIELKNSQLTLEKTVAERTKSLIEKTEELEYSKKSFEALLTNLQGMAYQYVPIGDSWNTTFVSEGAFSLTGYRSNDLLSDKVNVDRDLINAEFRKSVWDEITKCIQNKKSFSVRYPIKTATGAEKWVLDRGTGVFDQNGELISLEGLMIDITKEKLQEEKLMIAQQEIEHQNALIKQREERYATLLKNLQGMAYRVKSDLKTVEYISEGAKELTGYTSKEIINKPYFFEKNIVHKKFQSKIAAVIARALAEKQNYEIQYPILCKDKSEKWVTERGIGVYDKNGEIKYLEGFIIDITESKNREKELLLAKQTIDNAPVIIEWIKEDGSFFYVNDAAMRVSQYNQDDFSQYKVYDIDRSLDEKSWKKLFKMRNNNPVSDREAVYYKKDGTEFPVLINAFNLEYEGIAYNISFINDISKLKKIEGELKEANYELSASEEELRQQSEELSALNENLEIQKIELENTIYQLKNTRDQLIHTEKMASLGVLVAGIAHELNNPIGYIKTSAEALAMLLEDLKGELYKNNLAEHEAIQELAMDFEQMAAHIQSGAEQAAEIVRGLRTFSRMDKEKIEKHNIHDTINNVLLMLHNNYKYNIAITKQFGDIPPIECAPGQINQVFLNLINNAIQAIPDTGNITIKSELVKDRVIIIVEDDGPGIPKEMQSRIFEPFFTTKEPGMGTGLGLSISLGIIQDHHGSISFTSNEHGTTFTVSLPIKQIEN